MPGAVASPRYWVETLGCPKNAVDSDKVVASLVADGLQPADAAEDADLVIVNTCAFVEAAREESIETILTLAGARKPGAKLVVTGCLAERSGAELAAALPEVDAVIGFAGEGSIGSTVMGDVLLGMPKRKPIGVRDLLELPRAVRTVGEGAAPWAYLKIAEGCDRACAFCAIPSFRGAQRSRAPDALVAEARGLVESGVVELVLVAQDLAWYGRDVGEPRSLAPLLRRLDAELAPLGLRRIRLLYLYPSEVRDPLVSTMLELPTVVPYFDLSLQHADRALLAHEAVGERRALPRAHRSHPHARAGCNVPIVVHRRVSPARPKPRTRRCCRSSRTRASIGPGSSPSRRNEARPRRQWMAPSRST